MRPILSYLTNFWKSRCVRCRNYSEKRESRIFRKMILREESIKKKRSCIPSATSLHQYARNTLRFPENRRRTVLNKVFMDHISELMNTGTYSDEMLHHGIHITQARVTPNYHVLYVYWVHTKDINESEVDGLLAKVAGYIRYELTSSRVIGQIPEVRFVKDEDFVNIQLAEKILDQLRIANNENFADQDQFEQNIMTEHESHVPPMQHNVFGLEYLEIMNNVKNAMRKCGVISGEVITEPDLEKEGTQKFSKKELKRTMFSKRYEMKKLQRLNKKTDESSVFEDVDVYTDEECGDWHTEDGEIDNNHINR